MTEKFGLIFDMDGTMIDNMMIHHRAWQKKLSEIGLELSLEEVIAKCHGLNDDILVRLFGDKYTFEERDRISAEKEAIYRAVFLPDLKLIEGLPAMLEEAAKLGIPMGIGTAARSENVDYLLDNLNIRHYFKAIVSDVDVQKGKPDPEVFFKVAQQLEISHSNCLVFEDSPTGAKTALNAGMKAIILTTTHKAEEFSSFESVLKCIDNYTEISLTEELEQLLVVNS
ncbi:haloacid dehalogenase superfamily, subfamily IA, variant 3 with third motif having DD or ED [Pseudarcicella hirudinis]|uniref:Haloacid dehalogenase superfamily, subfamily IA, variant 3 with third motif having DD or ED n=1 Tax=Pseudarcicella hirudinis TaxID=1079859 RepID=A0A1I5XCK9_9BACT|nr:HAD family phosphatase [Pseudarcicella hirudinis]SFQ29671.1 haloacid dehalogenase superfamily, subfamily IA, variant 3 with third motif having DD or ED [Pseudarcicella hirudinis]